MNLGIEPASFCLRGGGDSDRLTRRHAIKQIWVSSVVWFSSFEFSHHYLTFSNQSISHFIRSVTASTFTEPGSAQLRGERPTSNQILDSAGISSAVSCSLSFSFFKLYSWMINLIQTLIQKFLPFLVPIDFTQQIPQLFLASAAAVLRKTALKSLWSRG